MCACVCGSVCVAVWCGGGSVRWYRAIPPPTRETNSAKKRGRGAAILNQHTHTAIFCIPIKEAVCLSLKFHYFGVSTNHINDMIYPEFSPHLKKKKRKKSNLPGKNS